MPNWSNLEEIMRKTEPVRRAFGPVKNKAIPVFEDCINYPIEKVVALAKLSRKIEWMELGPEAERKIAEFKEMLAEIKPVENAKPRLYLWQEGNMPAETDYTDNSQYRYNHNPDFKPYLFELLLPEGTPPKGAVIFCAGGDHGDAVVPEGYQTALDFHVMGYQCFILLNRTNHNPWTAREAGADAARAVRMVRKNAEKYGIRPDQIAYAGFSNGGLTGEGLIQHFSGEQTVKDAFPEYRPDELDEINATPDTFLCVYGPRFVNDPFDYERVVYPPTFFAVGKEDTAMDNLHYTYADLVRHGVTVEAHTFVGVPHGQAGIKILDGEVKYPNFELWLPLADAFLQNIFAK